MKLLVLYKPKSEHARVVEEYIADFKHLYPDFKTEMINAEDIDGVNKSVLYDILDYPALLACSDDGTMLNMWVGPDLPQKQEVIAYLHS